MAVTSTELLRFILGLLGDSAKAEEFMADPAEAMASAGLSHVTCADVDAITPVIANASQGAVAIAGGGGTPAEMVQHIVKNVAVSNFDNSGVIQNIWSSGEVSQAFAGDGGIALGGDLVTDDPIITGDGNTVATDTAQAAGRDIIQNQGDGNLALGGDQTIAQDDGVIAGGDALAQGDKVGGNNNEAENTGNDNSVHVGGNQNNAENTGNTTLHDQSVTIGDVAVDLSDRSDNSVHVGGNQNNAENTGNDNSLNFGDISLDLSDDHSVGGDYWENGSNVGGIGNTDNRNSGNTTDSGNTVTITETRDESINVGSVAIDLSDNSDNSVVDDHSTTIGDVTTDLSTNTTVGDVAVDLSDDHSTTVGDVAVDLSDDHSTTVGDVSTDLSTSTTVGDVAVDLSDDHSTTVGDVSYDASTTSTDYSYEDQSYSYGDYYEQGSGNSVSVDVDTTTTVDNSLTADLDVSLL